MVAFVVPKFGQPVNRDMNVELPVGHEDLESRLTVDYRFAILGCFGRADP